MCFFSAIGSGGICRGGILTVLHTVTRWSPHGCCGCTASAELTLYGDGCDAVSEHLICAALRGGSIFPGLLITLVEIGSGQGTEHRQSTWRHGRT